MFRIRELFCGVILLAIISIGWNTAQRYQWSIADGANSAIYRSGAKRHSVAALSEQWSTFQIPADAAAIRVLANAAIDAEAAKNLLQEKATDQASELCYAIDYELLNQNSKVLRRGSYHFRSKLSQKVDQETGDRYFPMRLADSESVVSPTRSLHLMLDANLQSTRQLRIRKSGIDDDRITEVLARAVCRTPRRGHSDFGAWQHVSETRKQQLARHSVYDHQMLDDQSRHQLLRWQWSRAIPQGQHRQRRLYSIGSEQDAEVATNPTVRGAIVGKGRKIVLPVGDQPVALRIVAAPLNGTVNPQRIKVTWIDRRTSTAQRSSRELDLDPGDGFSSGVIENVAGLVELESEQSASLRFWTQNLHSTPPQRATEIFFEPKRVRTYLADQRPVIFPISHVDTEATPLKVALRAIVDQQPLSSPVVDQTAPATTINWRMIDQQEQVAKSGVRTLMAAVSTHERIEASDAFATGNNSTETDAVALTEATELWFSLPANIKRIEFWSKEDRFLINSYVRTEQIAITTQVPEDYQRDDESPPQRRWFTLRPANDHQYVSENRMLALRVQPRLEELDEEANAEEKRVWQQLLPSGDWIATRLFVPVFDPMESQVATKPDSQWLWHQLRSEESTNFNLIGRSREYRSIDMAFISSQPAGSITVYCNGQPISQRSFTSSRGQFSVTLPAADGAISARFDSEVKLFVSRIETDLPASRAYFRRSATRIDGKPASFEFDKSTSEDQCVTLTLFRDQKETTRATIKVRIIPQERIDATLAELPDYTMRERSFSVRPQTDARSLLVDRPGTLDQGSDCFIKLGSDLPPGRYSIEVQREDAASGLLLMYRMLDVAQPVRRLLIHNNPNAL